MPRPDAKEVLRVGGGFLSLIDGSKNNEIIAKEKFHVSPKISPARKTLLAGGCPSITM
jgi:hypothetical protein